MSKAERFARRFRVEDGKHLRLDDVDPGTTGGVKSKAEAQELLEESVRLLSEKQEQLYAQDQWAVLLILQGMDAAGKDSVIKHVMSGVNPEGCQVYGFKEPSAEELNHDFFWRTMRDLPERGKIGIFNRSYYEEVLIVRIHPEVLAKEKIPRSAVTENIWKERFEDIRAFERYLAHNGVVVRKFFLHISKKEQKQRFLRRLEQPEKNWKFTASDVKERELWDGYMRAYEEMIQNTATPHAPWYVVPGDHKWFARLVVASAIVDTLESLKLALPKIDPKRRRELKSARDYLKGKAH
jgi:PPK2 family polyphosphate:nucleotide phosphotransferase